MLIAMHVYDELFWKLIKLCLVIKIETSRIKSPEFKFPFTLPTFHIHSSPANKNWDIFRDNTWNSKKITCIKKEFTRKLNCVGQPI